MEPSAPTNSVLPVSPKNRNIFITSENNYIAYFSLQICFLFLVFRSFSLFFFMTHNYLWGAWNFSLVFFALSAHTSILKYHFNFKIIKECIKQDLSRVVPSWVELSCLEFEWSLKLSLKWSWCWHEVVLDEG